MQSSTADSTQITTHHTEAGEHPAHPDFRMFGVLVFLCAESMIFLGLFIAYLTYKLSNPNWSAEATELELLLPGINTFILISSSFVIHQADKDLKADRLGWMQLWYGVTALMGAIFLVGQIYEYTHLEFGLTTNLFASTFYVLTGFHGLHVLVGLLLMLAVLWRSRKAGHYSSASHFGPEATELYWHFVDVIWIILFGLLYIWQG